MKMGKLIVLEGPDTAGKTTIINKLKTALPIFFEKENFIFTREPGNLIRPGENVCEKIRKRLLKDETLTPYNQAKLFAVARKYHVQDIIKELKKGNNVITDRFILSSIVYQGIDIGKDKVLDLNSQTLEILKDEEIEINNIVLHITKETYNKRMSKKTKDAMESVDEFTIDVRLYYHSDRECLEALNIGNIYQVDANNVVEDTLMQTLIHINTILKYN